LVIWLIGYLVIGYLVIWLFGYLIKIAGFDIKTASHFWMGSCFGF